MSYPRRNERGIALVLSVVALVMMGALVAATFTPSLLEQRTAENVRRAQQAFEAAEFGLAEAVRNWEIGQWNAIVPPDSLTMAGTVPNQSGSFDGVVHRLNDELFLLDVTGSDARGGARQRIGQMFKLDLLEIDIQAALTTRGPTTIGGTSQIDGNDAIPSGWTSCGDLDSTMAGLRLQSLDDLTTTGGNCRDNRCMDGNPPVEADSTISDSTFFNFGGLTWDDLVGRATKVIPPGTYRVEPSLDVNGGCDASDNANWGDPLSPTSECFDYFPVIYVPGDMTVNGSIGQGVLLVEGNLYVQGGLEFYGITIVRGQLRTTGTGGHFNGAVLAANVDLDDITVLGDALVQFSSCAVLRALLASSPGRPLRSRGWMYTY